MNKTYRVTAVREDGSAHTTDITGFYGETLADKLFHELKEEPKNLFVLIGVRYEGEAYQRATFHRST